MSVFFFTYVDQQLRTPVLVVMTHCFLQLQTGALVFVTTKNLTTKPAKIENNAGEEQTALYHRTFMHSMEFT